MASAKTTAIKLLKSRALRQGLIGGSPFWRALWIAQFGYKQFSKISKGSGEAPISFDEPLKEGEVWAVVHEPEKTKKGRGEGRKFLIGPKRKKSRANIMTGLALGVAGEKILAAPSPERINQILGEDVFDPPALTKAQKRAAKKAEKLEAKLAKSDAKAAANAAKAQKKSEAAEAKALKKSEVAEAKAQRRLEKATAAAAAKPAKLDAKVQAKADAAAKSKAKADAKAQAKADAAAKSKAQADAKAQAKVDAAAKSKAKADAKAQAKADAKASKRRRIAKAAKQAKKAQKAEKRAAKPAAAALAKAIPNDVVDTVEVDTEE